MVLLYIASALDVVHLSHMVNYVKSKLNAICTELLEVYSYMRAITVAEYIPA